MPHNHHRLYRLEDRKYVEKIPTNLTVGYYIKTSARLSIDCLCQRDMSASNRDSSDVATCFKLSCFLGLLCNNAFSGFVLLPSCYDSLLYSTQSYSSFAIYGNKLASQETV